MRSEQKYSLAMRSLHWLVFLAVTIAVVAIEIHDFFPKGSTARTAAFAVHQTAGLSVLALMVLRLFVRWGTQPPAPVPGPQLLQRAACLTHGVLYLLMVGMPILGVLALAWGGKPIQPFGLTLTLPFCRTRAWRASARRCMSQVPRSCTSLLGCMRPQRSGMSSC